MREREKNRRGDREGKEDEDWERKEGKRKNK